MENLREVKGFMSAYRSITIEIAELEKFIESLVDKRYKVYVSETKGNKVMITLAQDNAGWHRIYINRRDEVKYDNYNGEGFTEESINYLVATVLQHLKAHSFVSSEVDNNELERVRFLEDVSAGIDIIAKGDYKEKRKFARAIDRVINDRNDENCLLYAYVKQLGEIDGVPVLNITVEDNKFDCEIREFVISPIDGIMYMDNGYLDVTNKTMELAIRNAVAVHKMRQITPNDLAIGRLESLLQLNEFNGKESERIAIQKVINNLVRNPLGSIEAPLIL